MITLSVSGVKKASDIAHWLNDVVAPGAWRAPSFSVSVEETMYWVSHEPHWTLKYSIFERKVTVIGLTDQEELMLLLGCS